MNPIYHYDPDEPYPESDGQPMAENTEQYEWLVKIKENLEILFADRPDVFVAGDLFWYPVPDRRIAGPLAPDVMVAIGRPKGKRGSYRQWEEGGIAPQVVFEILSPANSLQEMEDKRGFYERYGVQEYYVYDPASNRLEVWTRQGEHLEAVTHLNGWTSPLLGIRFALDRQGLGVFYPSGHPFLSSVELNRRAEQEAARAEREAARAEREAARAEQEATRAEQEAIRAKQEHRRADQEAVQAMQERQRAERLAAQLRALGIEPDAEREP